MIKLSVLIVNYNVKDLLLKCLQSIYRFDTNGIEVVVIDNASVDGSEAAVREHFPQVQFIANTENAGFPKANNQGFAVAKGETILMLNPDTELLDNAIQQLYSYLKSNPIAAVAPQLLNTDGSRQWSVWRFPSLTSLFFELFYLSRLLKKKNYLDQNFTQPFVAESVSGAAILFYKKDLLRIGNLDETLFWIEDVDFCYRLNQANLPLHYVPTIKIIHHIGQSAKKNYNISISNQIYNKIKFFKKHHSFSAYVIVVGLSFIHVVSKIIVFGLLAPFNFVYLRKAKAYVYTLTRVFNPPTGIK